MVDNYCNQRIRTNCTFFNNKRRKQKNSINAPAKESRKSSGYKKVIADFRSLKGYKSIN
jgi:hypothetical protein